jgi:hypothetical protein
MIKDKSIFELMGFVAKGTAQEIKMFLNEAKESQN